MPTWTSPWRTTLCGLSILLATSAAPAATVVLGWDPNPEPNVAHYRLYYGGAPGVYTNHLTTTAAETRAEVEGLLPESTYYFAVTAVDSEDRESGTSNEVAYTLPPDPTPPDPTPPDPTPPDPIPVDPTPLPTTDGPRLRLQRVDGRVRFSVVGQPGTVFELETSRDLIHWTGLGTFQLAGTVRAMRLPESGDCQFFRTVVR